jgi:hypothetical protein
MTEMMKKTLLALCGLVLCTVRSDAAPATAAATEVIYPTIEFITDPIPPGTTQDTWLEDHSDGSKAIATNVERLGLPLSIALVVSSERAWLRSNEYENDRRPASGYALVDSVVRHLSVPSNTKLVVVTYDREARVALPPTSLAQVPAQPLGPAQNYGNDGKAIELGLRLGLDQLATVGTPRKLLLIVGDGGGAPTTERSTIEALAKRARDEGVELVAINYALDFEGEPAPRKTVLDGVMPTKVVVSPNEAAMVLQTILAKTQDSYRVVLDARDLSWDGELHPVTLRVGGYHLGRRLLHLPRNALAPSPVASLSSWRWPLVALAVGFVGLLVLAIRRCERP